MDDGITLANGGTIEETVNYFPLEAVTIDNVQSFLMNWSKTEDTVCGGMIHPSIALSESS